MAKVAGMDLNTAYEAIRISGQSVRDDQSQVIRNGSRDINFTMDLVDQDVGLFYSRPEPGPPTSSSCWCSTSATARGASGHASSLPTSFVASRNRSACRCWAGDSRRRSP